jgi:hypothetical protein
VLKLCGDDDTYIKDMGTFNGYVSSGDDGWNDDFELDYGCVAATVMMVTNGTMMTAVVIGVVVIIL